MQKKLFQEVDAQIRSMGEKSDQLLDFQKRIEGSLQTYARKMREGATTESFRTWLRNECADKGIVFSDHPDLGLFENAICTFITVRRNNPTGS